MRAGILVSIWTVVVAAVVTLQPASAADGVGFRQITIPSAARAADLDVIVWYPASAAGEPAMLGESIFFEGTPAVQDAPIMDGTFPLILLSHGAGLGGRAQAMSWIAGPLAQRGFVVAAPTHPGNTGRDRSAAQTMKLWLRPADISATLDAIEADADLNAHLAPGKVGVLGLSMGGHTALSIAGARIDPARLAAYCDTPDLNASLCGWVRQSGVDLHAMDMAAADADLSDDRVRVAMAVDPALVDVFADGTFADIAIPVDLVNLGPKGDIPVTVLASEIADVIPDARYAIVEDASHYSMFGVCKPAAADIAAEEGIDEPICADGDQRTRAEIHAQLVDMTAAAFQPLAGPDRP